MMSLSGSSSSRGRSASPFRFRKSTSNSLERLPGFISFPSVANANSPHMRINSGASSSVDSTSPVFGDAVAPAKENVCVTIRFRPLSTREIHRGDEVAWYAEGDTMVRSEYNPVTAYAFDKVFGPTTTTHGVYDFAAKHVVRGAMEGINGTVFAYGVTSSGKTHTMHGDQKSPGIIPLAIKDVFSIIQETVGRDFLLRVSYLEIYNEIINDLLDPTAQNLRVREDSQGTYVEGIKEEVVLSPAHALSLIAAGEEHRHVGSNNFNLFSSRSHTIFTLTIESSSHGDSYGEVILSQLNLIDLAGSESSKTETTGLRRKEGAYINKSLLTLGTVIAKLSDGKACHIPYRDSKLTRLLQSSLSGRGRVSLICTITPASSNMEETHNTLKFAYRAKRLELYTNPTRIIDDKSLIKKYQKQIATLKQELERVKRGYIVAASQEDLAALRQKLEAGQVKMRSRLEEEEQEKAALMGRIQRLTKLILVSTKTTVPIPASEKPTHRRRYSFGEDELAYLPVRKRDLDDDLGVPSQDLDSKQVGSNTYDIAKDEKKNKKRGMLSWFKLRRSDAGNGNPVSLVENDNHSIESPRNSVCSEPISEFQNKRGDDSTLISDSFLTPTQAGELFSVARNGRKPPPTGTTMTDQIDLLREQMKMLAGEVALTRSSLKRLTEQAASNPDDTQLKAQIQKLEMEIKEKQQHIDIIQQRMIGMGETSVDDALIAELQQTISNLTRQLDEKTFELEIKSADNRILQEQLEAKSAENMEMQGTVLKLQEQLESALTRKSHQHQSLDDVMSGAMAENGQVNREMRFELTSSECIQGCCDEFRGQMLLQAAEVESLKQEKDQLIEEKEGLQIQGQKLSEEASYAKELASAAAVELKALAEEVTRLSYQNAKLVEKLEEARNVSLPNGINNKNLLNGFSDHDEAIDDIDAWNLDAEDLKRELRARKEREASLEAMLAEKVTVEAEFVKKIDKYKRREADLENELAGMWVRIANLKKEQGISENTDIKTDVPNVVPVENGYDALIDGVNEMNKDQRNEEMADDSFENQTRMCAEVVTDVSQIKIEGTAGGNFPSYEISDILL